MPTVGESPRLQALKRMSDKMPQQNQKVAQGLQAARGMQLQQVASQAPASTQAAQQIGAQQAQQAGAIAQESAKQQQAQQTQVGQLGLQERGRQLREQQAQSQLAAQSEQQRLESNIADFGAEVKQNLFDRNMQFKKDELGRTQLNENQLQDWAVTKAQTAEEYNKYAQIAEQELEKELYMMDVLHQKATQALEQEFLKAEQSKDQEAQLKLAEYKRALDEAMQRKQADARNKQGMWQAGGQILGAAAGAVLGGMAGDFTGTSMAAGAAVGSSIGGGLGTVAGSQ